MTEGQFLFSLDYEQFRADWSQAILFKLQREFERKTNISLSQSLLISQETEGVYWLLVDFEKQKTYDIRKENDTTVEVSDGVDLEKRADILSDAGTVVPRLQEGIGTHTGTIDALKRLNFDISNLENLKRSELSPQKLGFESVYPDLEFAYEMLNEILNAPRSALINLPSENIQQLKNYVLQSYEMTRKIMDFGVGGRDATIRERHVNLLQEIHQFCENVKRSLFQAAAYLSSRTVEQLEDRINSTLTNVEERLNTTISSETEKLLKIGEEAQQIEEKRQENFDQLHLQLQNQLTEKPISQYKAIFNEQAEEHRKNARFWMWMAITATAAFGGVFILLSAVLGSGGTQLTGILQNIFTKGFVLSPIYVWLNRSIKNHTAQKHLEVINVHRQNALETFDTFVAAAEGNRETRDAVLLAATKAIFDANQSGYLSTKTSGSDNTSPVQQIIKEVIPTKSSEN